MKTEKVVTNVYAYGVVLHGQEGACYEQDIQKALKIDELFKGDWVIARMRGKIGQNEVVREYRGKITFHDIVDMKVEIDTVAARPRRPLSEPTVRRTKLTLNVCGDGLLRPMDGRDDRYGYLLPAAVHSRGGVPRVPVHSDDALRWLIAA